jgi:hypothetical protein
MMLVGGGAGGTGSALVTPPSIATTTSGLTAAIIEDVTRTVNVVTRQAMRASQWLAGGDSTARGGLPAHEVLAPLPLLAIALLLLNDRVLKGTDLPELITGKLSDVTGVFVFPLVATAVVDLVGYALRGLVPWDYTLRRWKLAVAISFTALVFGGIKLSPWLGGWAERAWSAVVPGSTIYPDPTDAIALIMLAGTWLHGRRAIARGSYGRLAFARSRHAAGKPLAAPFSDAAACGAVREDVGELDRRVAEWLQGGDELAAPVDQALARLR